MFKKLTNFIFDKTGIAVNFQSIVNDSELRSIVVFLLIKLGQADGNFEPTEAARVVERIERNGRVGGEEAVKVFQSSLKEHQGRSLPELLAHLRDELSAPQKAELVESLYDLMMVDREPLKSEKAFVSTVASGIGLSEEAHSAIYQRVRGV